MQRVPDTQHEVISHSSKTLEEFLQHIEKRAFVMARVATGNEADALDIVQDAMIKLVNKYAHKENHEWPPLFYRILQSRIYDWHRQQQVRNRWRVWSKKIRGKNDDDQGISLENHSLDQHRTPDEALEDLDFGEALETVLSHLPLRQKQAFMLRAWESYSVKETSQIMKCSEGSVKTHYSRALTALREQLQDVSI